MMMIMARESFHLNPTVQVPPWDDPTDDMLSPLSVDVGEYDDVPFQLEACDDFRMYEFKVRRCGRGRSHDWTECPYAHPGEKARRRDPRKFHYSGNPCPELRKQGTCQKGDTCEFAHGVFECWLHPSRYRTQPCKDGVQCRRRICFFAHTPDQLRLLSPESYDHASFGSSPTSILYTNNSPISPVSYEQLASYVRNLQIGINGSRLSMSPISCSPRSLASTPTRTSVNAFDFDLWDHDHQGCCRTNLQVEEEPMMERVESGKEVRAKIYAKLSRENSITGGNSTT